LIAAKYILEEQKYYNNSRTTKIPIMVYSNFCGT